MATNAFTVRVLPVLVLRPSVLDVIVVLGLWGCGGTVISATKLVGVKESSLDPLVVGNLQAPQLHQIAATLFSLLA